MGLRLWEQIDAHNGSCGRRDKKRTKGPIGGRFTPAPAVRAESKCEERGLAKRAQWATDTERAGKVGLESPTMPRRTEN